MFKPEGYNDSTACEAFMNIEREERAEGKRPNFRPVGFICSPYAGDVVRSTENAPNFCRMAYERGFLPIAPHLYFLRFLNDNDTEEREDGLFMRRVMLTKCAEM